ncbi:MAG TPA: hypothetical protein VKA19_06865, partial [Alphaproteobacteria bacterium]|nr:hypothetical protein [Alphaproteobacteria bacterium]
MKTDGALGHRPEQFHDIFLPKNTGAGVVLGAASFVFGFAMVWHIWWLAILGLLGIVGSILARTFGDDSEHRVPAQEIERIEKNRPHPFVGRSGAPA